jgi:hypothetical protein
MNLFGKAYDYIISYLNRKQYRSQFELSKKLSIYYHLLYNNEDDSYVKIQHPLHAERIKEYIKIAKSFKKNQSVDINFGDSLSDMTRDQMLRHHNAVFSISGSWAHHVKQVIEELKEHLAKANVKNISIGCLGGNPMLVYRNYEDILKDTIDCMITLRSIYPKAHIIYYGLPPVFNINVLSKIDEFNFALKNWCIKDGNASFLDLKEHFGVGFNKLFPSIKYGSDGVHFNPNGATKFSELIHSLQVR